MPPSALASTPAHPLSTPRWRRNRPSAFVAVFNNDLRGRRGTGNRKLLGECGTLHIFNTTLQFLLTFGIPVAFMAYFPAVVLLGRTRDIQVHPIFAYGAPLAGVVWMALALYVFQREMRNYQSAGH